MIKNEEETFLEILGIRVGRQLRQAALVGSSTTPDFKFHNSSVLIKGDDHVQAALFGNVWLLKTIAVSVEDRFEKSKEHQATIAFEEIPVVFAVFFLDKSLKVGEYFAKVQTPVGAGVPLIPDQLFRHPCDDGKGVAFVGHGLAP